MDEYDHRWLQEFRPLCDPSFNGGTSIPIPQNIVSFSESKQRIPTMKLISSIFMPSCKKDQFAATTVRMKNFNESSSSTIQVFDTGKCMIMGLPTLSQSYYWIHTLRLQMASIGVRSDCSRLIIENAVASGHTGFNINLGEFARKDKIGSVDQKESFPGVLYYFKPSGRKQIEILLFESGKIIYMGTRKTDSDSIREDFSYIYPILEKYRSFFVNQDDVRKCKVSNLIKVLSKIIPKLTASQLDYDEQYTNKTLKKIVKGALFYESNVPYGLEKALKEKEKGKRKVYGRNASTNTEQASEDVSDTDKRVNRERNEKGELVEHGFKDNPSLSLFDLPPTAPKRERVRKRQRKRTLCSQVDSKQQTDASTSGGAVKRQRVSSESEVVARRESEELRPNLNKYGKYLSEDNAQGENSLLTFLEYKQKDKEATESGEFLPLVSECNAVVRSVMSLSTPFKCTSSVRVSHPYVFDISNSDFSSQELSFTVKQLSPTIRLLRNITAVDLSNNPNIGAETMSHFIKQIVALSETIESLDISLNKSLNESVITALTSVFNDRETGSDTQSNLHPLKILNASRSFNFKRALQLKALYSLLECKRTPLRVIDFSHCPLTAPRRKSSNTGQEDGYSSIPVRLRECIRASSKRLILFNISSHRFTRKK